jgi:uncharacterized protein YsxB (DUF464 family)
MEGGRQYNIMDSYESSDNALMDSFKAAALKVTTLYKDSLVQNRKAYASGYQQALQDLYEFISAQPENGFIPVQDVLAFARQKNNQLTSEMNGHADSTTSNNNNTTTAAAATTTTTTTNGNNTSQNQTTAINQLNSNHSFHHHGSRLVSQAEENAKLAMQNNPFQIDPHSQFTFTHDVPALQSFRSMDGLWDQATTTMTNEGFKRRMLPAELSFMGRPLNVESAAINNGWHEPPFKRGRLRREEQQLQLQIQQQQLQQQQQQLQLLQQQQQPPHL